MNRLTIKEREFVHNLLDKDNPETYSNQTRSYMKAYGTENIQVAAKEGSRNVRIPHIREYLEELYEKKNVSIEDRVQILSTIAHGHGKGETTTYRVREGKEQLETRIETSPSFTDRIKAVDVLTKVKGDYDKVRVMADVAKSEYARLCRDILKDVRDATRVDKKYLKR